MSVSRVEMNHNAPVINFEKPTFNRTNIINFDTGEEFLRHKNILRWQRRVRYLKGLDTRVGEENLPNLLDAEKRLHAIVSLYIIHNIGICLEGPFCILKRY
jgi:hypothetical protein